MSAAQVLGSSDFADLFCVEYILPSDDVGALVSTQGDIADDICRPKQIDSVYFAHNGTPSRHGTDHGRSTTPIISHDCQQQAQFGTCEPSRQKRT